MTKEVATVTIPGIHDESFDVPREHTRAWDPSHSLYLEVTLLCKLLLLFFLYAIRHDGGSSGVACVAFLEREFCKYFRAVGPPTRGRETIIQLPP